MEGFSSLRWSTSGSGKAFGLLVIGAICAMPYGGARAAPLPATLPAALPATLPATLPAATPLHLVAPSLAPSLAPPSAPPPALTEDDTYYAWTFDPAHARWARENLPDDLRLGRVNPNFMSPIPIADGRVLLGQSTIFDPRAHTWTTIGDEPYIDFAGLPTPTGAFGFGTDTGGNPGVAFVFDAAANAWRPTRTPIPHTHAAPFLAPLPDGRILVVGRLGDGSVASRDLDLFDPITESWSSAHVTFDGHAYPSAVAPLRDGRVAIVLSNDGGNYGGKYGACTSEVVLYDPGRDALTTLPATAHPRCYPALAEIRDPKRGAVLVVAGGTQFPSDFESTAEPTAELLALSGGSPAVWETIVDAAFARYWAIAIPYGDREMLFEGGMSVAVERTVPDLVAYDFVARKRVPFPSAWPAFKLGYASAVRLGDGRYGFFSRFIYQKNQ